MFEVHQDGGVLHSEHACYYPAWQVAGALPDGAYVYYQTRHGHGKLGTLVWP